jgi:hypothetical protein
MLLPYQHCMQLRIIVRKRGSFQGSLPMAMIHRSPTLVRTSHEIWMHQESLLSLSPMLPFGSFSALEVAEDQVPWPLEPPRMASLNRLA